jgi:CRISPR/Cas system-associated exonuclease Cas4 (RecB family)
LGDFDFKPRKTGKKPTRKDLSVGTAVRTAGTWDGLDIMYQIGRVIEMKEYGYLLIEFFTSFSTRLHSGHKNIGKEKRCFYVNLNNEVLLNGFIDRVQIDPDGVLHVADYKTTKDPKYLKDFFQLITYCYTLCLEDPSLKRIRASFILLRHNFDYITQEFNREDVISVAEKFMKTASDIEDEKLWRANPQFLCKYCDYLEHCRSGRDYLVKRGVLEKKKPVFGIRKW